MAEAYEPATPAADLAARKAWTGPTLANGVLTPDLVAIAQGGVGVILASVAAGRPVVGIGLGCRVEPDGRMRVIVERAATEPVLAAIDQGSGVAVTFSRPHDHRAFQVKARRARVAPIRPDDLPEIDRQCAVFRDELTLIGYDLDLAAAYVASAPGARAAIEFVPEAAFVQTPGPGAGSALVP